MKWTICLNNSGYEASLEKRKLYTVINDEVAEKMGLLRVIDESEEGYLYPSDMFAPIALQGALESQLLAA